MIAPAGTVEAIISNDRVACVSAEAVAFKEAMRLVPVPAPAVLVMSVVRRKLALDVAVPVDTSFAP